MGIILNIKPKIHTSRKNELANPCWANKLKVTN